MSVIHVRIPRKLSDLSTKIGKLNAMIPVAEVFHAETETRAAKVAVDADGIVEKMNAIPDEKLSDAEKDARLVAVKDKKRVYMAADDAAKDVTRILDRIQRYQDIDQGYRLVTGQAAEGYARTLPEEIIERFQGLARELRSVVRNPLMKADAKKTERARIRGEMVKLAKLSNVPVEEVLSAG